MEKIGKASRRTLIKGSAGAGLLAIGLSQGTFARQATPQASPA